MLCRNGYEKTRDFRQQNFQRHVRSIARGIFATAELLLKLTVTNCHLTLASGFMIVNMYENYK